jgi:hypothetical protein
MVLVMSKKFSSFCGDLGIKKFEVINVFQTASCHAFKGKQKIPLFQGWK